MSAPPSDSLVFSGSGEGMAAGVAIGGSSASISRSPTDSSGEAPVMQAVVPHTAEPRMGPEAGRTDVPGSFPWPGGMTMTPHGNWTMDPSGVGRVPVASTAAETGVPRIPSLEGQRGPAPVGQIVTSEAEIGASGPLPRLAPGVAEHIGTAPAGCRNAACAGGQGSTYPIPPDALVGMSAQGQSAQVVLHSGGEERVPVASPAQESLVSAAGPAMLYGPCPGRSRAGSVTSLAARGREPLPVNHRGELVERGGNPFLPQIAPPTGTAPATFSIADAGSCLPSPRPVLDAGGSAASLRSARPRRPNSLHSRAAGSDGGQSNRGQDRSSRSPRAREVSLRGTPTESRQSRAPAQIDLPARFELATHLEAAESRMQEMEAAHTVRYSRLEQETRAHLIGVLTEADAERRQRVEAQQHARWLEENSEQSDARAMHDGLEDVIELDRARQERDWARAELRAMGEEYAATLRSHQADIQSSNAVVRESARAEFQAQYDSTVDDFQRQCNQHILEIHEQVLAHERTIAELRSEVAQAGQAASCQESQVVHWWRNEACVERQARECAQGQARDAEARADHLQTEYYRQDAELERRADEVARMRAQLAAADDRATRVGEEMVVMQARFHSVCETAGAPVSRPRGASVAAPTPASCASGAGGGILSKRFAHPLLGTNPPGVSGGDQWMAAPANHCAGGIGSVPMTAAAAGMSGAYRVPVAPVAASMAAQCGIGAHGVIPAGLPDQRHAPYQYDWRGDGIPPGPMPGTGYHHSTPAPAGLMQADATKRREADHFSVPPIPSVVSVTAWKREVREAVAAASANPDLPSVYRWVVEAEEKMADPDAALSYHACPPQFRTLDSKFLQALANRIKGAGMPALANKQQELSDDAMARGDGVLTGRRVYYAILQHLRVSNGLEMRNSLVTLQGIEWPGDEHMERFSHVVNDYAREAMRDGIDETIIMGIVYEKMLRSKALEIQLSLFRLRPEDDPERSWKGLLRIIHEKVEQERNDRLRVERTIGVDRLMRGGSRPQKQEPTVKPAAPAPVGFTPPGRQQSSGSGKGQREAPTEPLRVCWYYNHGGCRFGDRCKFEHQMVRPNQKALIPVPRNVNAGASAANHHVSGGQGGEKGDGSVGKGRGRSSGREKRGTQGADSSPGSPGSLGSGAGRGQPRMCMQFQDTGYCRWGDACSNLHAGDMADVQRAQSASVARDAARQGQQAM